MQKLLFVILISFLLFSCGDSENTKNSSENSAGKTSKEKVVSSSSDSKFDLSYSFREGQSAKYKLNSVAVTNQKINSMDSVIVNEVTQNSEYVFVLTASSVSEKQIDLAVNILSINITTNYNGEIVEYNSEIANTIETQQNFSEYAALAGNSFGISINRNGRILEVTDVENVTSKYLEIQQAPSITEEERAQLTTQLKDQALQPLCQQLFKYLPAEEIKIDSTWDLTYPSRISMFELQNRAVSRIGSIVEEDGRHLAKILTDLQVDISGDGNITQGDVKYRFDPPQIDGSAETYFDFKLGLVTKSKTSTETKTFVLVTPSDPNIGKETAERTDLTVNDNYLELLEVK